MTASAVIPGSLLCERYRVTAHIADSAVASVYQAEDAQTGGTVALKILDPLRAPDPITRARFEREFDILSRFAHAGLARALALTRHDDLDILVMEYVEGECLADRLARGRLPVDEAIAVAERLARALAVCHEAGVLHRDLKPANVILHPERGPVILDFGVAWLSAATNLTRTGAVIGSPQYMAPETFTSALCDARSDLYSLGAILFESLCGRPVRTADAVCELALQHLREPVPQVISLCPDVPLELSRLVDRAIAVAPEERFSTAIELADALSGRAPWHLGGVRTRLPCPRCKTALVVDVPFCPGCGRAMSWQLEKGPYAVQLVEVPDTARCAQWLQTRHGESLRVPAHTLEDQLRSLPAPLAAGVSESTAERLQAETHEAACGSEIVRARSVGHGRLRASNLTAAHVNAACLVHYGAVTLLALVAVAAGAPTWVLLALPVALGALGYWLAQRLVRRPLLERPDGRASEARLVPGRVRRIQKALSEIETDRARSLAASAVLRSAPVLSGDTEGLPSSAVNEVLDHLDAAVKAARDLDVHARLLVETSRSRLLAQLDQARKALARGDAGADARVRELEERQTSLLDASLAHDIAARESLGRCASISALLQTRTAPTAV